MNLKNSLLIFIFLFLGCESRKSDKLLIVTSIEPQAQIVRLLVDTNLVTVKSILPPGLSPGSFSLRPSEVMLLSKADIYVRNYVPFEVASWENILSINSKLTSIDVVKELLLYKDVNHDLEEDVESKHHDSDDQLEHHHSEESEEHDHNHDNLGYDPHYWLSLKKNIEFVSLISSKLIELHVIDSLKIAEKRDILLQKLETRDRIWSEKFSNVKRRSFVIYHPNLSYVAKDYNLVQYPLEIDGKSLTPKIVRTVAEKIKSDSINTIFFQKEFDVSQSKSIAKSVNVSTEAINTLSGDFFEMIDTLYSQLYSSFNR